MSNGISRRAVTQRLLLAGFAGNFLAYGQDRRDARDLVDRVQEDLQRAADFTRNNEKERERYHNAQHHLSEFDRQMRSGHFDKGKLDDAIDDLKNLVQNNTLESRDRDALARDLADLRVMRDMR
jgi:uncharacterized membrane protein YccC